MSRVYDIGVSRLLGPQGTAFGRSGGGGTGSEEDEPLPIPPDPGNAPPGTLGIPSTPTLTSILAGYQLLWDGKAQGGATMPFYRYVEVHNLPTANAALTDTTVAMQILGPTDVLVPVDGYNPVWVRLCAVNSKFQRGGASTAVQVKPGRALDPQVIADLKAAQAEIDARIAIARQKLAAIQTEGLYDGTLVEDALATLARTLTGATSGIDPAATDLFDINAIMLSMAQAAALSSNVANSGVRAERVAFIVGGGNLLYNSSIEDPAMSQWPGAAGLAVSRQTGDSVHGGAYLVTTVQ